MQALIPPGLVMEREEQGRSANFLLNRVDFSENSVLGLKTNVKLRFPNARGNSVQNRGMGLPCAMAAMYWDNLFTPNTPREWFEARRRVWLERMTGLKLRPKLASPV